MKLFSSHPSGMPVIAAAAGKRTRRGPCGSRGAEKESTEIRDIWHQKLVPGDLAKRLSFWCHRAIGN